MSLRTQWQEETTVKTYETDYQKRWKPASFFQVMQEAATHHADHLGFGFDDSMKRNQVWILSRVKVRFLEFPYLDESVIVHTWPKGIRQKIFFMREFNLKHPEGRCYALASSAWVLMNPNTRRMLPPNALEEIYPENNGLDALEEDLEKIVIECPLEEKFQVIARYSAVDMVGHVNNVRYVEWACDCFPFEAYHQGRLEWLQVNFSSEVKPGETVSLAAGQSPAIPGLWLVEGTNLTTGVKSFDAAFQWKV